MTSAQDQSLNRVNDDERLLSQTLFEKVKPFCIELSQTALQQPFNPRKAITLLISIENALRNHHEEYSNGKNVGLYKLSPNIADYIFFPLSNLLKQPSLDDTVIQHLFGIIGFLIKNSWSFNVNFTLIDQLFPLIIFLSAGDINKEPLAITTKTLAFKLASAKTFASLADALDRSYFQESSERRLVLLSNTITITLAIVTSTKPDSQESIEVILQSLDVISKLKSRLSNDQQSVILPGIVSAITKFTSSYPNLNYQIIIQSLRLLSGLICVSFSDKDLGAELNITNGVVDMSEIHLSWDEDTKTLDDNASMSDITISENDHRSMSWLKATSKQLKISLMIFFKTILLGSRNKQRLQTREELVDEIVHFVESILKTCFVSLYQEFASLAVDVYSILAFVSSYNNQEVIDRISNLRNLYALVVENQVDKEAALYEIVKTKLTALVDNKFSTIIFSTDEEKISMNITAIEFNFSLLLELSRRVNPDFNDLDVLKQRCLTLLQEYMVDSYKLENSKAPKAPKNNSLIESSSTRNQLDSIELPEFVNTRNIVKQDKPKNDSSSYIHNLRAIARNWSSNEIKATSTTPLVGVATPFLETALKNFVQFLSSLKYRQDDDSSLNDLERILETSNDDLTSKSVSLWVASNYASSHLPKTGNFDPNDFLALEDDDMEIDGENESSYLILAKAEELMEDVIVQQQESPLQSTSLAYTSALLAITAVTGTIPLEQFRSSFLMDYLLSIFQALTYNDVPQIQAQAQATVKTILDTYYNGSIVNLISDNLDYLIDNISLQLSVASNLTPTLPGIMLVIIKVAGVQLLESNQLHDVLTDMFVILDSYHGYNKIVESFFIVFESLIEQIKKAYDCTPKIETQVDKSINNSLFKPWGMTNKEQLLALIDRTNKVVDEMEEYDRNKEYFKRKEDLPFSEMDRDSDDEEEEAPEDAEPDVEEPWTSPIPKDVYGILKRIFNYGFTLVSQPSYSLKSQIIKTLRLIFPLVCTNYKDILPVLATNWPILITLITGSKSLSTSVMSNHQYSAEEITIMTNAFQFVTDILNEDRRRSDFFFNKKFQDAWEFMSKYTQLIAPETSKQINREEKQVVVSEKAVYVFRTYPVLKDALVKFLITGVQNYERMIPDLLRYDIIKMCYGLKIPSDVEISRDTRGVLIVLQTAN
ncbi:TEL2-interacting protein 1 [Candida viswanathii]|uniref:TEL2-interacting protein 1 n=1 Tax=Candida viswanathii TaxID=5486 RepID=A0A367XSD7_9ASCO|nr:TEL2-interacting protein 1 [Candida viswanathii]